MNNEKMMILNMIEQGKISSEEGIKLLEALNNGHVDNSSILDSIEDLGNDFGRSFNTIFTNLENFKNSVISKGYDILNPKLNMEIKDLEKVNLYLNSINGDITLNSWDKDYISLELRIMYRQDIYNKDDEFFKFSKDKNSIIFIPLHQNDISISIEAFIPDIKFEDITLASSNGKISMFNSRSENIKCIGFNEDINLEKIQSNRIIISAENSKVTCNGLYSKSLIIKTSNSSVCLDNLNIRNGDITTENASIYGTNIDSLYFNSYTNNGSIDIREINSTTISLTSSNGKLILNNIYPEELESVNLLTSNSSINVGFYQYNRDIYFDLITTMGNIDINKTDLITKIKDRTPIGKKQVLAHSKDLKDDFIKFTAFTSNGSILIS